MKVNCERQEPLITWAVRAHAGRQAVHVSMLSPKENGAACSCLCYACGDKLLAINVDKPADHFKKPGAQRRHFKHDHGAADRKCQSAVAKLIALALFIEQDEIILPARSLPATRQLLTGKSIEIEMESPEATVKVAERRWIDDQSAVMLLADGRELIVTVRTNYSVDADGVSRSVLSFAGITNPEVAGWTSEEILAHLRLPGSLSWERHWDDEQLNELAQEDFAQMEARYLSDIPREWLEGLSGKMASETILHWVIKRSIERRKILKVPAIAIQRSMPMPDGTVDFEVAKRPEQTLLIDRVTFERKLGDIVPDVVCWASKLGSNDPPFQLLIEAAVTHYVDEAKQQKILGTRIPCIQIRADLFSKVGSVPVDVIEHMVCSDAAVKEWIAMPDMANEISKAELRLESRARRIQQQLDEKEVLKQQLARDKAELALWYQEASDEALAKGYLKALSAIWRNEKLPAVRSVSVDIDELWRALVRRDIVSGSRSNVESISGLLHLLWKIRECSRNPRHADHAIGLACSVAEPGWLGNAPKAVLAMYALKAYIDFKLRSRSKTYQVTVDRIKVSLESGEATFVRTTELDPLLRLLFPEMSADLEKSMATHAGVQEARARRDEAEARARNKEQRREQRLSIVAEGRAAQAAKQRRIALDAEIASLVPKVRWVRTQLGIQDVARLYGLFGASVTIEGIGTLRILKSALELKAQGRSIRLLLQELPFKDPADIRRALQLLQMANICVMDDISLASDR